MANVDRKGGFRPVGHLNGNPWNGKGRWYYIPSTDSTAVFHGDAVKSAGSSDTSGKYATVAQAAATNTIRGVVIGFANQPYISVDTDNLTRSYRPASTAMYCLVVDDPDVIFEIQEDNASNDMDADMVGLSTDIVVGTGDTTTGLSAMELDSSDTATAAGQCKILGVSNKEDNALGTYCKWDVLIIEHEMRSSTDV
jgi:hypothetical protein